MKFGGFLFYVNEILRFNGYINYSESKYKFKIVMYQ